jgi:hypothetical protein
MVNKNLIIDSLIVIDDTGMPVPPTTRQLLDRDIRELYRRDKTPDKKNYIAECIVIYYLGDPKSPARQSGLNEAESLKLAIEQAGLEKSYVPDALVIRLIQRYYEQNITEAGKVVENMMQTIHNINLYVSQANNLLNEKLNGTMTLEELNNISPLLDSFKKQASDIPKLLKSLEEAKQNLMYEKETEISRGGVQVLSSMRATDD